MPNGEDKYYPAFDYLRILLATAVAVAHSGIPIWERSGGFAVQVFFALSGWLIGGILLASSQRDFPRFYFNRATRIWIPYAIAIFLLIAASLLKEPITKKWVEFFFYDMTFVYNIFGTPQIAQFRDAMPLQGTGNHFWSICAEEQFYLVAPLLIISMGRVGRSPCFWICLTAAIWISPLHNQFAAIALGVTAAALRHEFGDLHLIRPARLLLFSAAAILSVLMYSLPDLYEWIAPASGVFIVLALAKPGNRSRVGKMLGGISYPLYLNQWIGFFAANAIFGKFGLKGSLLSDVTGVVLSIAVSTALYLLIDTKIQEKRGRFFSSRLGKMVGAIAFGLVCMGLAGGLLMSHA